MHRSLKEQRDGLAYSALQIFLLHTLNDTKDIISAGRDATSLLSRFSKIEGKNPQIQWTLTLQAATRVVCYIQESQKALETYQNVTPHFLGILCAVAACQDSLHEALQSTRCYPQNDYTIYTSLSEKHALKVTYLTCVFKAVMRDDQDLSQLWELAASKLNEEIEMGWDASQSEREMFKIEEFLHKSDIQEAAAQDKNAPTDKIVHLRTCLVRHYRRAAVMVALNRHRPVHEYAAGIYVQAIVVQEGIHDAKSFPEKTIFERTAAYLQLAIERIEAQEISGQFHPHDPTLRQLVQTADHLVRNAALVHKFVIAIEAHKAKLTSTIATESKCRDATMLPVWNTLRAEQENALVQTEACLQGVVTTDGEITASLDVMRSIVAEVKTLVETADEIQSCRQRAMLFRKKATQAVQGARPSSSLAHKCWTQAAVHMDAAAQVCIDVILNGTWREKALDQVPEWKSLCNCTSKLLAIAERVLPRAVEYMDKARGAEAGEKNGRDPREAQMWRKAAECLLEKAELQFAELDTGDRVVTVGNSSAVLKLDELFCSFSQIAEYFFKAFKHRATADTSVRPNGRLTAVMYECAAELMLRKLSPDAPDVAIIDSVLGFHLEAIKELNACADFSLKELFLWERGSEYGMSACDTTSGHPNVARHWSTAFFLTAQAQNELQNSVQVSATHALLVNGQIDLHVYAARTTLLRAQICYEACIDQLSTIIDPVLGSSQYQLALVAHMLKTERAAMGPESFAVPPAVRSVLDLALPHEYPSSVLDDHAQALLLKAKCPNHLETLADEEQDRQRWEEAYRACIDLCQACHLCSVELPKGHNSLRLLLHLSYRMVVAKIYVTAALSTVTSPHAAALTASSVAEAEAVWPKIVATVTAGTSDNRIALIAVEQYTWAAEQAERQAAGEALSSHERMLRKVLSGHLREAARAAERWYLSPDDEEAKDQFYCFEREAMNAVEQHRAAGVHVAAFSLCWGK